MKISNTLKKIIKKDGRRSFSVRTVNRLKSSKEFSYLVDVNRA